MRAKLRFLPFIPLALTPIVYLWLRLHTSTPTGRAVADNVTVLYAVAAALVLALGLAWLPKGDQR
jgi:hypothetical protein